MTLSIQGIGFWIAVLMYRNERYLGYVLRIHDAAEIFDKTMLFILALWQISIHYECCMLYQRSGLKEFLQETEIFCVMESLDKSNTLSSTSSSAKRLFNMELDDPIGVSKNIYRPYPSSLSKKTPKNNSNSKTRLLKNNEKKMKYTSL